MMPFDNAALAQPHFSWNDAVTGAVTGARAGPDRQPVCDWTILLPFFNERLYLPRTIASIATQDRPFRLILIDNGSNDGSADIARVTCRRLGLAFTFITEARPGKVSALAAGLERVTTRYVATCDADTWYPSNYLSHAARLLAVEGSVAAGAFFVAEGGSGEGMLAGAHTRIAAALLPDQCHTGGAGHAFRTESLRRAGGFDPSRWNWALEDHEIMHRIAKLGSIEYGARFWCAPSPRGRPGSSARWTLAERILYHVTPAPLRDGFFYGLLAKRLETRRRAGKSQYEHRFRNERQNG